MIRKTILTITFISLIFFSCGSSSTSGNQAEFIITHVNSGNFSELEECAPFLSRLDEKEKISLQQLLAPYRGGQYNLEVRRQGFRTETLFLTSYGQDSRTLVMTMTKSKGQWILRENISFQQTIGFIPREP